MPRPSLRRLTIAAAALLLAVLMATPALAHAPLRVADAQEDETEDAGAAEEEAAEEEEQEGSGEGVRGTLRQPGEEGEGPTPVEGAQIVVRQNGQEIGTITTDAEGAFEFPLPGPGEYEAELLLDTLPEDAVLTNEEGAVLEFSIAPGQSRPLLFRLGEPEAGATGGDRFRAFLQLAVEGFKLGLIIAITSIGLSLIFGTTGLVNFAHGEVVSFGAILAYLFNVTLGIHLIPAAVIAIVFGALTGALLDRGLWRPLRRRGTTLIAMLVVSIGLSLLWRYGMLYQFGGGTRSYAQYAVQRAVPIGPIQIAPKDIISVVLSLVVLTGVGLMLLRTRIGKAMRAVADNRDLAASSGIDVERVIMFVWALGGGLATLGGVLYGLAEQVSWQMGFQLLLLMFAGVILGGLGTAFGALLGSLLVGLMVQLSTLVISPELKNVGAFVVLILVLLVRPQGLLGRAERIG
ncbi:MAG TPA: branched-chain amino acid ABC transporter permease [Euzebyales bacterium]|nr:branched-chain amino acid ABC transporter permease [Euzebyales bacterium]